MSALLRAECDERTAVYVARIQTECRALDNAFVTGLLECLQTLQMRYGSALGMLKSLLRTTAQDATSIADELRILNQGAGANKYEFDQQALDDYRKQFQTGRDGQNNCAHRMRLALRACIPEKPLSNLDAVSNNPTDKEDLEEALRKTSMESARLTQQQMVARGQAPNLLGDSLLDRLQARFANNPQAIQAELSEFVNLATSNLHWTDNHIQPSTILGNNVGVSRMPRRLFVLGLPVHPFSATLKEAFAGCRNAGQNFIYDIYSHNDPAQLRLLLADYWMAARFSTVVNKLSIKYAGVEQNRDANTLYFCNLDPGGEAGARVPILLPSVQEMRERFAAELWLGQHAQLKVIEAQPGKVVLVEDLAHGKETTDLGASMEQAVDQADFTKMFKVHRVLTDTLQARLGNNRQAWLLDALKAETDRVEKADGLTSDEFRAWNGLRQQLIKLQH
jgi:hypothetical protein